MCVSLIDSNIAEENKNVEVDPAENDDLEEGENEEEILNPSDLKDAQLPDVDPKKIKVEKKDMYGRWCIFDCITFTITFCCIFILPYIFLIMVTNIFSHITRI